jgi:Ras-related protein Rab-1A
MYIANNNAEEKHIMQPRSDKPNMILSKNTGQTPTLSHKPEYDFLFKIKLIGDSGVGKTCLLLRGCENTYTENYISTIGTDFKIKEIKVNDKIAKLQIWDTAGQEIYRTVFASAERGSHALILVFDYTDQATFNNCFDWLKKIPEYANPENCVVILVGNKSDIDPGKHMVRIEAVKAFMESNRKTIHAYIETSAKTGENVEGLFQQVTRLLIDMRKDEVKAPAQPVTQPPETLFDKVLNLFRGNTNPPSSGGSTPSAKR